MSGSGFTNDVMHAENVDFSGGFPVTPQVTSNGQLLIGSSVAPNIRVATLASGDGSVVITNGNGTIDLSAAGMAGVILTGDTGSASGANITLYANNAAKNAGSSVKFVNSGSTSTLNVTIPILLNTFLGVNAGTLTASGSENTSLGSTALGAITSGVFNTAVGSRALQSLTSGVSNAAFGLSCMAANNGQDNAAFGEESMTFNTGNFNACLGGKALNGSGNGSSNSCVGYASGNKITSGARNTLIGQEACRNTTISTDNISIGYQSLPSLVTGSSNIVLGLQVGSAYTGAESNNIIVGHSVTGVIGESNVMRLGGTQTSAYMAGIASVVVANQQTVVIDSTTGQLGAQTGSPQVVMKSSNIDFKTTGATLLFTPSADFVITAIYGIGVTIVGSPSGLSVNFGTNAASYDNFKSGSSTFPTTQGYVYGDVLGGSLSQVPYITSGTGFYINVATADTGSTTNTQRIDVLGYYR